MSSEQPDPVPADETRGHPPAEGTEPPAEEPDGPPLPEETPAPRPTEETPAPQPTEDTPVLPRPAAGAPVVPDRSEDDTDAGWGERPHDDDERLLRDVPPHWG